MKKIMKFIISSYLLINCKLKRANKSISSFLLLSFKIFDRLIKKYFNVVGGLLFQIYEQQTEKTGRINPNQVFADERKSYVSKILEDCGIGPDGWYTYAQNTSLYLDIWENVFYMPIDETDQEFYEQICTWVIRLKIASEKQALLRAAEEVLGEAVVEDALRKADEGEALREAVVEQALREPIVEPALLRAVMEDVIRRADEDRAILRAIMEEVLGEADEDRAILRAIVEDSLREAVVEDALKKADEGEVLREAVVEDALKKADEGEALREAVVEDALKKADEGEALREAVVEDALKKADEGEALKKADNEEEALKKQVEEAELTQEILLDEEINLNLDSVCEMIDFDSILEAENGFIVNEELRQFFEICVSISQKSLIHGEYFTILIYLLFAILLSFVILGFSYLFVVQNPETEKMSAYECGFEPYEDARQKFDVKFYIVAMLFIIFDIETMYLIPWCVSLPYINSVGYFVMMEFILELCVGFLYVWYIGGLEWD
jgi:NADH-quinone oxidoreductase subunit A